LDVDLVESHSLTGTGYRGEKIDRSRPIDKGCGGFRGSSDFIEEEKCTVVTAKSEPIPFVIPPIFATITYHMWSLITQ
jgi:hypothetical protein